MKLLKVDVKNFKRIGKDFSFSFIPIGNKTLYDKEFELEEIAENLFRFRTIGVIGKNASGKTTTVELLSIVYDILANFSYNDTYEILKFVDNDINFDITFFHDNKLYRYIFDLYKESDSVSNGMPFFKNEKVYVKEYKKTQYSKIFDYSTYDEFKISKSLPKNTSIIYDVLHDITPNGFYCPANDRMYNYLVGPYKVLYTMDKDLKMMKSLLAIFDSNIKNIEMLNDERFRLTYSNDTHLDLSNSELIKILSSGTSKGFSLYSLVAYSLKTGTDLIVDEIENHFHKTLVENLINLYKDKTVNSKNATLIFTTHYCEILDMFNRSDNIYIAKCDRNIYIENMYKKYNFRNELSKSNKFYNNEFNTNVDYKALMDFKEELF